MRWKHKHQGSTLAPLFNSDAIFKQKESIYQPDLIRVERQMGVDKTEVDMADRMTATEFTQRKDLRGAGFVPRSEAIYKGDMPILNSTLQYAYLSGRLPPPPRDLYLSDLKFDLEVYSVFSYGMHSEKSMNFMRAMAPFGDIFAHQPDLLDWIRFEDILKRSFANYELGNSLNTRAEVDQLRDQRAERMEMFKAQSGGGGQLPPETQGKNKAIANNSEAAAQGIANITGFKAN